MTIIIHDEHTLVRIVREPNLHKAVTVLAEKKDTLTELKRFTLGDVFPILDPVWRYGIHVPDNHLISGDFEYLNAVNAEPLDDICHPQPLAWACEFIREKEDGETELCINFVWCDEISSTLEHLKSEGHDDICAIPIYSVPPELLHKDTIRARFKELDKGLGESDEE